MPRGLEALIPKRRKKGVTFKKESIFWIEVDKIKPNPFQPRKEFNKEELKELATSIEKYGILQPLLVKKIEKDIPRGAKVEYQLVTGERRLKAAKMIGMKEVPVIIEDVKKEDELPISLVENIQREDLNPIERAGAFKKLIEEFDFTHKEIGKIVGKSRETISNALRILELPEEIKESIKKNKLSEGHAKVLLGIKKDRQIKIFKEILEKNLSVRDLEKRIKTKVVRKMVKEMLPQVGKKFARISEVKNVKIRKTKDEIGLTLIFQDKKGLESFLRRIKFS